MTVDEIKAHHQDLESMKTTQSVKLQMEKQSDAHEHRGILLDEIDKLNSKIAELELSVSNLQADIQHFWGEIPKTNVALQHPD
jgi:chromosome segregation ATPase